MWAGHTRLQNHVGIERMIENLNWNGATGWEVSILSLWMLLPLSGTSISAGLTLTRRS
jgi:hypothetical protein